MAKRGRPKGIKNRTSSERTLETLRLCKTMPDVEVGRIMGVTRQAVSGLRHRYQVLRYRKKVIAKPRVRLPIMPPETGEHWRPVEGCNGIYVSCAGRIWRQDTGRMTTGTRNKALTYMTIVLNGKSYYVHRLVLCAFIGRCPENHNANHKNFDRTDNRVANLEWVTPRQNTMHARYAGRGHHTDREFATAMALGTNPYLTHC